MSIQEIYHNLKHVVLGFFDSLYDKYSPSPPVVTEIEAPLQKVSENNDMTHFNSLKSLLRTLDETYKCMRVLKPRKHYVQKIIKTYGAYVMDFRGKDTGDKVSASKFESVAYGFPAFIINMVKTENEKKKSGVTYFFAAIKMERPHFEPAKDDCVYYEVTLNFAAPGDKVVSGYCAGYEVEVNTKTNTVNGLKIPSTKTNRINKKKKSRGGNSNFGKQYTTKVYEYPDFVSVFKEENDNSKVTESAKKQRLERMFYMNFNLNMRREMNININVEKNDDKCSFSVPENKWKYFFKDRIKAKTESGRTKPIFHCVTSHFRLVKGKHRPVKTHYRGVRIFKWSDYNIHIVMPGKHAVAKASFDVAAMTEKQAKKKKQETVDLTDKEISNKLNNVFGY